MPIIKIDPIEIKTSNGNTAIITGINPASTDSLVGYVPLTNGEQPKIRWDLKGTARDNDGSFNLRLNEFDADEFDELKQTAINVMLPHIKQFL